MSKKHPTRRESGELRNWNVTGGGGPERMTRLLSALGHHAWTAFSDKKGDWWVACQDDTPLGAVLDAIMRAGVGTVDYRRYGEMTTCIEEMPDWNGRRLR